jgi:ATP-binding cassette subfamily B (MDR/TAP) protein 8
LFKRSSPILSKSLPSLQATLKTTSIPLVSFAVGLHCTQNNPFKLRTVHCEALPFKPVLIEAVTPTKVLEQIRPRPTSITHDIWELVKPDLLLLACIILTAIGAAIIQLQTPLVTGQLINVLSASVNAAADGLGALTIRDLNGPALKLFALLTVQGVLTFAHIALVSAFGENMAKRLRAKLFAAMICQDISFFDCHRSGELVSRLTADVSDFKVKSRIESNVDSMLTYICFN